MVRDGHTRNEERDIFNHGYVVLWEDRTQRLVPIGPHAPLGPYKSRTQWKRTGAVVSEGRQVAEAGELIGYSAGRGRGGAKQAIRGGGAAVDDNQLYYDVVGGHDKKRRIYGLGSYGCSIVNGSTSDNTSGNMTPTSRPPYNATPASVQDEIQSLKAIILLMQQRLDAIDGGRAGTSSSPPSQTD
nr:uncharacterized protein LOC109155304 [Ipomoea batatas]